MPVLRRVGHKGAGLIEPGNTVASFEAAVEHGVDMIEFDVLPERLDGTGRLLLAHDYVDVRERTHVLTLEEGLDHLCETGLELNLDMKLPGYEARIVAALRDRGITDRVLVSSTYPSSLARVRRFAPEIALGWSVPRLRRNPLERKALWVPAFAGLQVVRRILPRRAARAIREGRCEAIMANVHLVTPALVKAVLGAGGEVYVWTVDHGERIAKLSDLGVTGVITNDPRLFAPTLAATPPEA